MNFLMGIMVGLLLGAGIEMLREYVDDKFAEPSDVATLMVFPVDAECRGTKMGTINDFSGPEKVDIKGTNQEMYETLAARYDAAIAHPVFLIFISSRDSLRWPEGAPSFEEISKEICPISNKSLPASLNG